MSRVVRGFVNDENRAYAVYVAGYTHGHPIGSLLISMGESGETSTPEQRFAVPIKVKVHEGAPSMMVGGPGDCVWNDTDILGRILDRPEALAHPRIKEVFHIADHVWIGDRRFSGYFEATA
jgi:hypothetical protein